MFSCTVSVLPTSGCRVIGICSTSQKAAFVVDECGADVCLTYKHSDGKSKTARELRAELAEACPKGIDIYFENVGGFITEAVFPLFNDFARVAACGMISHYQKDSMKSGPDSNLNLYGSDIVIKRITIKGFICTDYVPKFQAYFTEISKWISAGKLKAKLDVVEGSENCINALAGLFESKNTGKRIVTFCEQPAPGSFYAFLAKLILPKATAAAAVVAAAAVGYQFYQSKL